MKENPQLRKYSLALIVIYVLFMPLFIIYLKGGSRYAFHRENLPIISTITFVTLAIFLGILFWRYGRPIMRVGRVVTALLYGFIFAFAEEIIFRGVVQGFFEQHFAGIILPVLFSALVFGMAHLPNGAKGFLPTKWNWGFAGLTFLGGLPLGLLFAATGSLLMPTLLHAIFVMCLQLFVPRPES